MSELLDTSPCQNLKQIMIQKLDQTNSQNVQHKTSFECIILSHQHAL